MHYDTSDWQIFKAADGSMVIFTIGTPPYLSIMYSADSRTFYVLDVYGCNCRSRCDYVVWYFLRQLRSCGVIRRDGNKLERNSIKYDLVDDPTFQPETIVPLTRFGVALLPEL